MQPFTLTKIYSPGDKDPWPVAGPLLGKILADAAMRAVAAGTTPAEDPAPGGTSQSPGESAASTAATMELE